MTNSITRRGLLLGAAGAALGAGLWLWRARPDPTREAARVARLAELYSDPGALRRLGNRVLHERPEWADRAALASSVLVEVAGSADPEAAFVTRVQSDYSEGRVVSVDGWVLSEVEGRLFAWVAGAR